MKLTTFILLAVVSLGLNAAGKNAYIQPKVILAQSPQAIAANSELKKQFGARENDLRTLFNNIKQMEQAYQTDSAIMSAEQKKKAEDNIIQNKRRLQFEEQALKEDVQVKQRELLKQVEASIRKVIQAYGEKHGYDFIFTDATIAYANDALDVTDEIIEELKK